MPTVRHAVLPALSCLSCLALLGWRADPPARFAGDREGVAVRWLRFRGAPAATTDRSDPDRLDTASPRDETDAEAAHVGWHDVRDLVAIGYAIDGIASRVARECESATVTGRVDVLEVTAPESGHR